MVRDFAVYTSIFKYNRKFAPFLILVAGSLELSLVIKSIDYGTSRELLNNHEYHHTLLQQCHSQCVLHMLNVFILKLFAPRDGTIPTADTGQLPTVTSTTMFQTSVPTCVESATRNKQVQQLKDGCFY